jgi:hypothetical protein
MSDDTFFLWGTLITIFILFAFILSLRQMFQNRLAEREDALRREQQAVEIAESNSGL